MCGGRAEEKTSKGGGNPMQRIAQAKTILTMLPYVDQYRREIARSNQYHALKSFYGVHDTFQVMDRIIEKTYKSQYLENLKNKAEEQLNAGPPKYRKALELFFFAGMKQPEIAVEMDICKRTAYRLVEKATEWFATKLNAAGVTQEAFDRLVRDYGWIGAIYAEFSPR